MLGANARLASPCRPCDCHWGTVAAICERVTFCPYLAYCCRTFSDSPPARTTPASSVSNVELAIPDYTLFCKDRTANGGGVALYVHNSLNPSRLSGHRSLELITVRVNFSRQAMIIVSCYGPPNQSAERASVFVSDLTDWLASLGSSVQSMVLFSDSNADPVESFGGILCHAGFVAAG